MTTTNNTPEAGTAGASIDGNVRESVIRQAIKDARNVFSSEAVSPIDVIEYISAQISALAAAPAAPRPLTQEEHQVLRAAVRDSAEVVHPGRLVDAPKGEPTAWECYDEAMAGESDAGTDPVENLRLFCSFAMKSHDWLDAEPFFDAIIAQRSKEAKGEPTPEKPTLPKAAYSLDLNDGHPVVAYSVQQMYDFANASTRAAPVAPQPMTPETTSLILRDINETDPASPDAMGTVCISTAHLTLILQRHIEGKE